MLKTIYMIASAHLDREWYYPFEIFRARMGEIIKKTIGLLETGALPYFHWDGQMSVLEDFLELHPELEAVAVGLIREGKLIVGPWHVQPDEFLVSGESHVRNLLLARRLGEKYGVSLMSVGYVPDSFGHVAQLPQIFRGFGIGDAFLMRGLPDGHEREFHWESPDGSRVLALSIAYGDASVMDLERMDRGIRIADNAGELARRIRHVCESAFRTSRLPHVLFTYGGDHIAAHGNIAEHLRELAELEPEWEIRPATFEQFFRLTAGLEEALAEGFRVRRGELREGADIFRLKDTFSTRMDIKLANADTQNRLLYEAEPLDALLFATGLPSQASLLRHAWRRFVECHAHDSICGCNSDATNLDVIARLRHARQLAEYVKLDRSRELAASIDTSFFGSANFGFTLFAFGSASSNHARRVLVDLPASVDPGNMVLYSAEGKLVPHETLSIAKRDKIVTEGPCVQQFLSVNSCELIVFPNDGTPAYGYETFEIRSREGRADGPDAADAAELPSGKVFVGTDSLENDFLFVRVRADGTLDIRDKARDLTYQGVNYLLDIGDAGDVYLHVPVERDAVADSRDAEWSIRCTHRGDKYGEFELCSFMDVPAALNGERDRRTSDTVRNEIAIRVGLAAGDEGARVVLRLVNRAKSHLTKLMLPIAGAGGTGNGVVADGGEGGDGSADDDGNTGGGGAGGAVVAGDTPYFVAEREQDEFPGLHAMQTFVSARTGESGFAVLSRDLQGYRYRDGELEFHLQRGQDVLYREFADAYADFADSHGVGEAFEFRYILLPHGGDWEKASLPRKAQALLGCSVAIPVVRQEGRLPAKFSLFELKSEGLVLEACKVSEDGQDAVLRIVNTTGVLRRTIVHSPFAALDRVVRNRLDETAADAPGLAFHAGGFEDELRPYEVATYRVSIGRPARFKAAGV